jgi:hypothetical protein
MRQSKKTTRRGGEEKKLARWQQRMLDTAIQWYEAVDWEVGPQGEIYIRRSGYKQEKVRQLMAQGDDAVRRHFKDAQPSVRANKRILRNERVQDALNVLLVWAIHDKQAAYDEPLFLDDQKQILNNFSLLIFDAIKQTENKKQQYVTTTKAYNWIKPQMSSFREEHGIPNDKRLPDKLSRKFWASIKKQKRWQSLVKQQLHGGDSETLRRAVNRCWANEYKPNAGVLKAPKNAR